MFKEVNDAFNWMVSYTNLEKKPDLSKRGYRLDKMVFLLNIFNNPHRGYKIIHVAGSKGKGSTCGFLGSILTEAGFKTGIYSSPHLLDFRERITQNHIFFNNDSYLKAINNIKSTLIKLDMDSFPGGEPTTFELMTLAAFIIFKDEKCEWVVLETGLGGRLDSTNVVIPEASVITPIELEHTDLLGDTIEEIAGEKAGIIKKNIPVFTSNKESKVLDVIKIKAKLESSQLYIMKNDCLITLKPEGTFLVIKNEEFQLGLQGKVQGENALLAIKVINTILPSISTNQIMSGLKKTNIPGRFQKINSKVPIIIDGAHTKNSIKTTIDTFKTLYGDGTIIFGALTGKDINSMVRIIKESFTNAIISTPGTFKESNLTELKTIFLENGIETDVIASPNNALKEGFKRNKPILVTGSFYMAGEIAKLLVEHV